MFFAIGFGPDVDEKFLKKVVIDINGDLIYEKFNLTIELYKKTNDIDSINAIFLDILKSFNDTND